ncbi:MAG: PorT family protein [Prevotella sp.]|nr:PorT family protein [Prevotella sp.]
MLRRAIILFWVLLAWCPSFSQERKVENRPYCDLRQFHFGVVVGTHLQDIEFLNVGPQQIEQEDGTYVERLVSCDQDRWDPGFNVGVLGEFRLNTYFQFRVAPAMYFGTRHFTFRNHSDERLTEEHQDLKTAYITSALDLIFAAPRFNNHRPYLMAGLNPVINLSGKDNDYLRLKRYDMFFEVGMGCDFYLPFFKLRPELKFMFSLSNSLDKDHANHLKNRDMIMYTNSVSKASTKIIALSFYFE